MPRPSGSSAIAAGSTRAGTGGGTRPSPASSSRACWRRGPRWPPGPRGSRPGTTCRPMSRRVAARFMECFAAFLSYTDAQLARVLDFLEQTGDRDDTLVILVSDNGASSEGGVGGSINDNRLQNFDPAGPAELSRRIDELGGPSAHNNYPWGWTMAGNTPFKRWKREVHEGGRGRSVHRELARPARVGGWGAPAVHPRRRHPPHRVGAGRHRGARDHRVRAPDPHRRDQLRPAAGRRRAPTPRLTARPSTSRCSGAGRSYHDGWKAVTFKPIGPVYNDGINWNAPFSEDRWELYHVESDPAEIHDLAELHPDRLADMIERWWVEARRNQVLPLDNRVLHTLVNPKPDWRPPRLTTTYYPGGSPVPEPVAANVKNRSHAIEVDLTVPPARPPKGCCWPRARCSAASPSTCGRTPAVRAQPLRQGAPRGRGREHRSSPVVTGSDSASSARRRGGGPAALTVDGAVVADRCTSPGSRLPPSAPPAPV